MLNGTNLLGKDNPCWPSGNPAGAVKLLAAVPGQLTAPPGERPRPRLQAWIAGLPHRIGTWLYRPSDSEASWWHWQITELRGGFARSYRDIRFDVLRQLQQLTARRGAPGIGPPDEPGGPSALRPVWPTGAGLAADGAASPHGPPSPRETSIRRNG